MTLKSVARLLRFADLPERRPYMRPRRRMIGHDRDLLLIRADRFLQVALRLPNLAYMIPCVGVRRIDLNLFLERRPRVIKLALRL